MSAANRKHKRCRQPDLYLLTRRDRKWQCPRGWLSGTGHCGSTSQNDPQVIPAALVPSSLGPPGHPQPELAPRTTQEPVLMIWGFGSHPRDSLLGVRLFPHAQGRSVANPGGVGPAVSLASHWAPTVQHIICPLLCIGGHTEQGTPCPRGLSPFCGQEWGSDWGQECCRRLS